MFCFILKLQFCNSKLFFYPFMEKIMLKMHRLAAGYRATSKGRGQGGKEGTERKGKKGEAPTRLSGYATAGRRNDRLTEETTESRDRVT